MSRATLGSLLSEQQSAKSLLEELEYSLGRHEEDAVKSAVRYATGKEIDKLFNGAGNVPTIGPRA
jgi:hypothetical protein